LAEVGDRQAHELVARRLELHRLQQLARAALVLGPLDRAPAQLLQAPGELVAQALELLEREQAGALRRQAAGVGAEVREAVGDDRRALALEPCHLRAQRAARGALARLDRRRGRRAGSARYIDLHLQFAQGTSLERAHAIAHQLQAAIREEMPGAEVLVHIEPANKTRSAASSRTGLQ